MKAGPVRHNKRATMPALLFALILVDKVTSQPIAENPVNHVNAVVASHPVICGNKRLRRDAI
jgi:hypothetical protein